MRLAIFALYIQPRHTIVWGIIQYRLADIKEKIDNLEDPLERAED